MRFRWEKNVSIDFSSSIKSNKIERMWQWMKRKEEQEKKLLQIDIWLLKEYEQWIVLVSCITFAFFAKLASAHAPFQSKSYTCSRPEFQMGKMRRETNRMEKARWKSNDFQIDLCGGESQCYSTASLCTRRAFTQTSAIGTHIRKTAVIARTPLQKCLPRDTSDITVQRENWQRWQSTKNRYDIFSNAPNCKKIGFTHEEKEDTKWIPKRQRRRSNRNAVKLIS